MSRHVPFQVQLTGAQHRRLKELAAARGASMGSIVRESVAEYLAGLPAEEDPAFGIIGLIDDPESQPHGDPAVHHDAYLADDLAEELGPGNLAGAPREPGPQP